MENILNVLLMAWLCGFAFHSRPIGILLVAAAWYFQFSGRSYNIGPYRIPGDLHWPILILATIAAGLYCIALILNFRHYFFRSARPPYR